MPNPPAKRPEAPPTQPGLQNPIRQFMALKNAQDRLPGDKVTGNAARFLDLLCQPVQRQALNDQAGDKPAELAPELAKLRQELVREPKD